ncbi:MAG: aldehyde dehydrogenase family protein [Gammaproteobacteria bacterium]|nr:aldehyde dehydrogenase family protein [Gammaproteobacteria bacterium]MAY03812.1 aldehyde dehydrogenase family protein [Gammaproteobacteria bacterium]|tara:strand:+ start:26871 stop:28298 length:1428 start_codon:yes stop_codon:yes gene_type:complete
MRDYLQFYIDGQWVDPISASSFEVINPATEEVAGHISLGSAADLDKAAQAAARAFPSWSQTSKEERLEILRRIVAEFEKRVPELGEAISEEMGAPIWLAEGTQAAIGVKHFQNAIAILERFSFETDRGNSHISREPIGVCGFITPWNWPIHQICAKVAPALSVGCTVVLKPSEIAPFSGKIFADILHAAGVPAGVFNLVQGEGPVVGQAIAEHPLIDMVSITGSTRAGIAVAQAAAPTVKRVHQELGGKSPNILLEDADLEAAVTGGVNGVMMNSGQSCRAPTRMLVPNSLMDEVCKIAKEAAESWKPGDPKADSKMGPVISRPAWEKVQRLIKSGIDQGATLVTGGEDRPEDLPQGYFIKPTVFANVKNDMEIAREEIFGPVLSIIGYDTEEEAVAIANDTEYGLGGYVQSRDIEHARKIAAQIRAGYISINNAGLDITVPFGGYKHSGNGREFGDEAFGEFLEYKSMLGYTPS